MKTAEQITYLWIIRSGGEGGGRHAAISNADRYEGPICTGICTAGGAPGPRGGGGETPVTTNTGAVLLTDKLWN